MPTGKSGFDPAIQAREGCSGAKATLIQLVQILRYTVAGLVSPVVLGEGLVNQGAVVA